MPTVRVEGNIDPDVVVAVDVLEGLHDSLGLGLGRPLCSLHKLTMLR